MIHSVSSQYPGTIPNFRSKHMLNSPYTSNMRNMDLRKILFARISCQNKTDLNDYLYSSEHK